MSREILKRWLATASGFLIAYGGMVAVRIVGFGLHDPAKGRWESLLPGLVVALLLGLLTGLVSAPLSVPWLARRRNDPLPGSGAFSLGLGTGILCIFAVDLVGILYGMAAVAAFVVLIHFVDALQSRPGRLVAAIILVVATHFFLQSQTYRILRARQAVLFVEANFTRLRGENQAAPPTLEDLESRLGRVALLQGITSLRRDPWGYPYHYEVDPGDETYRFMSWGADGLPGPDPAIDPGTPGADIDLQAALGMPPGSMRPPPRVRVIPGESSRLAN